MSSANIAEFYNDLYRKKKNLYGTRPSPFVTQIPRIMKGGRVLDIGAGQGRNSLYLAGNGFDVTATDISADGIENIKEVSTKWGIHVNTQVLDVVEADLDGFYDVIICSYMMHHLSRTNALSLIAKMERHTNKSGLNIIAAFTDDGDYYEESLGRNLFFLRGDELKSMYAHKPWGIPKYIERENPSVQKKLDGTDKMNTSAHIMVRKIF